MIDQIYQSNPEELIAKILENPSCIDAAIEYLNVADHINFKHYKPHEKQLEFHATGLVARERMFRAANRIGKSYSVSMEGAMHLTGNYPEWWNGYRYLNPINMWAGGIAERELLQLKLYYVGNLAELGAIHPSLILRQDLSQNLYFIQHKSGGISSLRIKTYKQGEQAWQAETVDLIHLDEEPGPKIYSEAITRTASVSRDHYGMIMLSMTPLQGMTSLLLKFMDRPVFDEKGNEIDTVKVSPGEVHNQKVYIAATHDDAEHLDEAEKKRLYYSYDPKDRAARTTGTPSLGSGLIYPVSEQKLVCDPFDIPEYWPRCFGMDFGWHNTAAVFAAHDQDNDIVYLYSEYMDGHMTPQHHAPHLIRRGADWMPGAYDYAGENAGQAFGENLVELYEKEGIRNWVRAEKKVSEGIHTVLQCMESDRLKIFSTLKKTLAELRMYIRDDNGKVKKGNDHCLDSLRYLIMSSLQIARVKKSVIKKYRINTRGASQGGWPL